MKFFGAIAAVALMVAGTVHAAETVTITDVAGREVSVKVPAEKLILGEGRLIYGLATLDSEDPFQRVVGWRDDLKRPIRRPMTSMPPNTRPLMICRPSAESRMAHSISNRPSPLNPTSS